MTNISSPVPPFSVTPPAITVAPPALSLDDAALLAKMPDADVVTYLQGKGYTVTAKQPPTPPVTALPDMVVTALTWTPATPKAGDQVVFTATVKNQGTAPTPDASTITGISFEVDGSQVAWGGASATAAIAPGASITLTADGGPNGVNYWTPTAGSHSVVANVNDIKRYTESDFTNNTLTKTLTVAAAPVTPPGQVTPPPVLGSGKTYYLAANGNDNANGTSTTTPWASINRLNAALGANAIGPGDNVLFRRGDVFYGNINARAAQPPAPYTPTTYASYGTGTAKPVISGYKILNNASAWQNVATNMWRINLADGQSYGGNTANRYANTGFLLLNNTTFKGAKKWAQADCKAQWDFFNDGDGYSNAANLYVYSTANPTTLAQDIKAATGYNGIHGYNGLVIDGLDIQGYAGHGVGGNFNADGYCAKLVMQNCYVHGIGGAMLWSTPQVRYGNGIEFGLSAADCNINHNQFSDVFDVAMTIQGGGGPCYRMVFTDNEVWSCEQAWESGCQGSGTGLVGCVFERNVCAANGEGWSHAVRPNQTGTPLVTYWQQMTMQISIQHNVFVGAVDAYILVASLPVDSGLYKWPAGVVCDNNIIALRPNTLLQYNYGLRYPNDLAAWRNQFGYDLHSTFQAIPASVNSPAAEKAYAEQLAGM